MRNSAPAEKIRSILKRSIIQLEILVFGWSCAYWVLNFSPVREESTQGSIHANEDVAIYSYGVYYTVCFPCIKFKFSKNIQLYFSKMKEQTFTHNCKRICICIEWAKLCKVSSDIWSFCVFKFMDFQIRNPRINKVSANILYQTSDIIIIIWYIV